MGRILQSFAEKLKVANLPKKEVEVSPKHVYLKKEKTPRYVVTKITQRDKKKTLLYFASTADEKIAEKYSIRMCELINEEIRRRNAS